MRGSWTPAYETANAAPGLTDATRPVIEGRVATPGPGWPTSAPDL